MIARINGRRYVLDGPPVFQPVNEFITAIRQGNPTNDDRNLASFAAYEDRRAGIGMIRGNIREDFDKIADSDGNIGLRFDELIKPPLMNTEALSGATKTLGTAALLDELDVDGTTRLYLAFGDQLWYSDGTDVNMTKTTADPYSAKKLSSIALYTDPVGGAKKVFLATEDASDIVYFSDPTAGSPFTTVTGIGAESLFPYDGKLWAAGPGVLRWSIDPSVPANWNLAAATGAWPNRWRFIGVYPFGQNYYPYMLIDHDDPSRARIAVLDIDNYQVIPLDIGLAAIVDAFTASGGIIVVHSNGRDATAYDPQNVSKIDMDWRAQDRGGFLAARDGKAVGGLPHPRGPMLLSNMDDTTECQLFLYKTTGWHPYGIKVTGDAIRAPYYSALLNEIIFPVKPAGADLQLNYIKWFDEAYRPLADQTFNIETTNTADITPWFTLGFSNLSGPMLLLQCGGDFNASNQVKVEYQLDFDESVWTLLGTFPNTYLPGEPEITGRLEAVEQADTLLFNGLSGVPFTAIRFRYTLISSNAKQSPNGYPMVARFLKRPQMRQSVRWNIDVSATIGGRGDIVTPDDILAELREVYDSRVVPEIFLGSHHTWAMFIGMPYILQGADSREDIVDDVVSKDATIVVNVAELL